MIDKKCTIDCLVVISILYMQQYIISSLIDPLCYLNSLWVCVAFDVTLDFNYRGPRCLQGDYYKWTLVAPLCQLYSLWWCVCTCRVDRLRVLEPSD